MADKIVLLNAGHVEQIASPEELYTRPATCSRPDSSAPRP